MTRKLTSDGVVVLSDLLEKSRGCVAQAFKNTHYEDTIVEASELAKAIAASSGSVEALATAAPVLRVLAVAVAGGCLATAAEISRGTEVEGQAYVNARYILGVVLPAAIVTARATLSEAQTINTAELI